MVDSVIETTKKNSCNIREEYDVKIENMSRRGDAAKIEGFVIFNTAMKVFIEYKGGIRCND
jgi:predicted RNA-binding protein with TRAM domain